MDVSGVGVEGSSALSSPVTAAEALSESEIDDCLSSRRAALVSASSLVSKWVGSVLGLLSLGVSSAMAPLGGNDGREVGDSGERAKSDRYESQLGEVGGERPRAR